MSLFQIVVYFCVQIDMNEKILFRTEPQVNSSNNDIVKKNLYIEAVHKNCAADNFRVSIISIRQRHDMYA